MGQDRTKEQLREHYETEKELANKLRNSSKQERRYLYSTLYDELYRRVPHHPQLTRKTSESETAEYTRTQLVLLKPFLVERATFLEVGPGDCSLSYEVARHVKTVIAIDVSDEITKATKTPDNFQLILSDGCSIPVPPRSVDVAYSNQLMEHLHPDDAFEQLQNIYNALVAGGIYICITPNKLTGPHDISAYFDSVAAGFHLKEYTNSELSSLFTSVGFSSVGVYLKVCGQYRKFPVTLFIVTERILSLLPAILRNPIAHSVLFRKVFNCYFVGKR